MCVIEDLVLFIYSVPLGCKFLQLLGLYTLHLTGTPCDPSPTHHPSKIIG